VPHHLGDRNLRSGPGDLQETACERRGGPADVGEFLELAGVRTAPITDQEAHSALAAFSLWQGTGHPAQLNLGNCFAYAMAKNARVTLLFKGEHFDKTDTLPAVR
jgi:ribonuclease VapC